MPIGDVYYEQLLLFLSFSYTFQDNPRGKLLGEMSRCAILHRWSTGSKSFSSVSTGTTSDQDTGQAKDIFVLGFGLGLYSAQLLNPELNKLSPKKSFFSPG